MIVEHYVDDWRLKRGYFLKLHFRAGLRQARYEMIDFPRQVAGVPLFLLPQANRQIIKAAKMLVKREPGELRQAMNAAYAIGQIVGRMSRRPS